MSSVSCTSLDEEPTKRKKKFVPNYEVDGVVKVILNESTQTSIGALVGVDVTGEQPWKIVKKELLFDNIAVLGDDSPFAALKPELETNEDEDILLGYIPDETNDYDEFYVCLTSESKKHCDAQAKKSFKKQMEKLKKMVHKTSKSWKSLGSEKEIDDAIVKYERPLLKLEIKTKFPKPYEPKRFTVRSTDDINDAYTELVPSRIKYENVEKMRVDFAVQAVPNTISSEAQTILKFPENIWTQCSVDDDDIEIEKINISSDIIDEEIENEKVTEVATEAEGEEQEAPIKEIVRDTRFDSLNENALKLLDIVKFNSVIDLYNLDYPSLVVEGNVSKSKNEMFFEEQSCFIEAKTKGRVVSSVSWHPMWAGIIAVAYSEVPRYYITNAKLDVDEVLRDVYGYNVVLIWSIDDTLNPKLYLESTCEVRTITFCPFQENILIGGCVNGQVIIWDLKDKLAEAERVEVLTEEQEKYRRAIYAQLGWPKDANKIKIVRQTAISNLKKSHFYDVTDFAWIHPDIEINNRGKIILLNEEQNKSLQFMSVSLDGCVLIWNLKISSQPINEEDDLEMADYEPCPSPYKSLNKIFEPVFKIIVSAEAKVPLTSLVYGDIEIKYNFKGVDETSGRKLFTSDIVRVEEKDISQTIWLGSLYGEFFKISWSGHGEEIESFVSEEQCKYVTRVKLHDGCIVSIMRNPFCKNIYVTVGGKVFAFWIDKIVDKPLMWKRLNYRLTGAVWSTYKPSQIFFTTDKGNIEIWDFMYKSDAPVMSQIVSGQALIGININNFILDKKIITVSDLNGSLRVFNMSKSLAESKDSDFEYTREFFERELEAKEQYINKEKSWYLKHADILEKKRKEEITRQKERDRKAMIDARKEQERKELQEAKLKEEKSKVITPQEKWKNMQWKHAVKTIQEKKRLNKLELLKQVKPLQDLEASSLSRQQKYVEMLQNQQKIFDDAVSLLFPEVVPKPVEPLKLTPIEEIKETRRKTMEDYEKLVEEERKFIADNPYVYEFEWQMVMSKGKKTRQALDTKRNVGSKTLGPKV